MAVSLLAHEISDLCLAKPALRSLPISATVAEALAALRSSSDDPFISVWDCLCPNSSSSSKCRCVGKLSVADLICSSAALHSPISSLLSRSSHLVAHLQPTSSLSEAIDAILQGAQNLVIPINRRHRRKQQPPATAHNGTEFCWLTQEDVIRFLLGSIGLFSPLPALSVDSLGIVSPEVLTAGYHTPAIAALGEISRSAAEQTAVAVVDGDGVLIGQISPQALACCGESAAAAIATLSAGELMAYVDGGGPPPGDLVRAVRRRLEEGGTAKELGGLFSESSSSSEEEEEEEARSPTTTLRRPSARRSEAMVCHGKSSLVAVMIQAIAHRVSYVWVVDDDACLVGIVTFSNILRVFRECTVPS